MSMPMLFAATWSLAAAALTCLLLYRKHREQYEDDFLHLSHPDTQLIRQQARTSQQLDVLDRWVKVLVVAVVLYGVCGTAVYLFSVLRNSLNA